MTRFHYPHFHASVPAQLASPFVEALHQASSACARATDRASRLHGRARAWNVPDWLRLEIVSLWFFLALIALTFFL